MSISDTMSREQVWDVLKQHRQKCTLVEGVGDWKEAAESVRHLVGDRQSFKRTEIQSALNISAEQLDEYLGNMEGRKTFQEFRVTGWKALLFLGIAVAIAFSIFDALMRSTPREIEGETEDLRQSEYQRNQLPQKSVDTIE